MSKRRHTYGPTAAARLIGRVTEPALRRRGFAAAEVILRWKAIVGEELARVATPEKLTFPRNSPAGGTLHIRVAGASGVELQHRAPQIIDRINTFYGYRAVARLRLIQGSRRETARREAVRNECRLTPEQAAAVRDSIEAIENPRLKAALERLERRMTGN